MQRSSIRMPERLRKVEAFRVLFSNVYGLVKATEGVLFFFFSSRRRHTRSDRDWSSDVCSSDLGIQPHDAPRFVDDHQPPPHVHGGGCDHLPPLDKGKLGRAAADVDVEYALSRVDRKSVV